MLDLFNLLLQAYNILRLHALHHKHGEGPCSEFVYQNILSHHGLDISGKIRENIIVDPGIHIAQQRRNQKRQPQKQDRYS